LESKPDHIPAFLALAKLLSRSPGRIDEADDLYKKALQLERDNADVYIHYCKYCLDAVNHFQNIISALCNTRENMLCFYGKKTHLINVSQSETAG
jgi:thioredoxin-like negative regulator of GroEL